MGFTVLDMIRPTAELQMRMCVEPVHCSQGELDIWAPDMDRRTTSHSHHGKAGCRMTSLPLKEPEISVTSCLEEVAIPHSPKICVSLQSIHHNASVHISSYLTYTPHIHPRLHCQRFPIPFRQCSIVSARTRLQSMQRLYRRTRTLYHGGVRYRQSIIHAGSLSLMERQRACIQGSFSYQRTQCGNRIMRNDQQRRRLVRLDVRYRLYLQCGIELMEVIPKPQLLRICLGAISNRSSDRDHLFLGFWHGLDRQYCFDCGGSKDK
ncbi:MAG: hypothetical protein J3Q66DRAFT_354141 [Benniella sp.]|nr:MAG: hypothetical protein J3Q66DRAFT_354141 [Benniella sp.]